MQLLDKRMAACCSTFRAPGCIMPTLAHPPVFPPALLPPPPLQPHDASVRGTRTRSAVCMGANIGVCFYRGARVCAGTRCYARNVFNFSEPRITVLPECMCSRAPPRGGRYRGEYSGYNGCCEHLRFSACEMSSSSTLNSLQDGRISAGSQTNDRESRVRGM